MLQQKRDMEKVSLEPADGFLNGLETRLCRDIDTAQHRVVIAQAKENLEMVRELQRRLVLDQALLRMVPSQAASSAVGDVMRDFERRVVCAVDDVDKLTEKMVSRHADDEELEQTTKQYMEQADAKNRGFFGRVRAATLYRFAGEVANQRSENLAEMIRLRNMIDSKRAGLMDGQRKIMGLIEEFIEKGIKEANPVVAIEAQDNQ